MRVLPRSWYFYYGRKRLYRRLIACANGLALVAGVFGFPYLFSADRTEATYPPDTGRQRLTPDEARQPAKAATENRYWQDAAERRLMANPARQPARGNSEPVLTLPNCNAAWAAGKAPIHRGEPGYSAELAPGTMTVSLQALSAARIASRLAGLDPPVDPRIHDRGSKTERRGWPALAGHDGLENHGKRRFKLERQSPQLQRNLQATPGFIRSIA